MIINQLATLVNHFISDLYQSGIKFYQIILALIIFNFIIYEICKMIKQALTRRDYL